MNKRSAIVMVILFASTLVGWALYIKEFRRATAFAQARAARENLDKASANLVAGQFVTFTDGVVHYRVQNGRKVGDQTFFDWVEASAKLAPDAAVITYLTKDGTLVPLSDITSGTAIRILVGPDPNDTAANLVNALYVIE